MKRESQKLLSQLTITERDLNEFKDNSSTIQEINLNLKLTKDENSNLKDLLKQKEQELEKYINYINKLNLEFENMKKELKFQNSEKIDKLSNETIPHKIELEYLRKIKNLQTFIEKNEMEHRNQLQDKDKCIQYLSIVYIVHQGNEISFIKNKLSSFDELNSQIFKGNHINHIREIKKNEILGSNLHELQNKNEDIKYGDHKSNLGIEKTPEKYTKELKIMIAEKKNNKTKLNLSSQ